MTFYVKCYHIASGVALVLSDGSANVVLRSSPLDVLTSKHVASVPAAKRVCTLFERRCYAIYDAKRDACERIVMTRNYDTFRE